MSRNPYRSTLNACYVGFITQATVNNLAPLLFIIFQNSFHISYEMLGRLVLINFGVQILADWVALHTVDRIGYRTAAVLAHAFAVVGLVALGVLPMVLPNPYLGLTIAIAIYAVGGGFIEVLISPIVDSLPGDAKASAMSLLHSFYCWGQMAVVILTTLALKIIGTALWFWLPIVWALLPLYNLFRFLKVPLLPPVAGHERISLKVLIKKPIFLVALLLMLSAGASELTMSQWSSLFAERGLGVPKVMGDLLGPCLFAFFMGIGRTLHGVLGHRFSLRGAMHATAALCVLCYLVTVLVPIPVIALLGCALCGFSVSLMWPGTFSLVAEAFPKGGTAMFGLMAVFGDLGASVGPWLAGFISDVVQRSTQGIALAASLSLRPDQLGLKAGLLLAVVFPLMTVFGLFFFRHPENRAA
jgi:fucose permease